MRKGDSVRISRYIAILFISLFVSPIFFSQVVANDHRFIDDELISNIVKIAKNKDINYFVEYFNKGNINVKKSIPIILGKIQNKDGVEFLINLFDDQNALVRKNSVEALGNLINSKEVNNNHLYM